MKTVRLNKTMNCVKRALVMSRRFCRPLQFRWVCCQHPVKSAGHPARVPVGRQMYMRYSSRNRSSRSHIYVTGPYTMGGSLMVEDTLELDPETTTTRLQIGALGELGSFCAYWIDDDFDPNAPLFYDSPTIMFDHPVRFAWTKQGSSRYGVLAANNSVTIYCLSVHPKTTTLRSCERCDCRRCTGSVWHWRICRSDR